MRSIARVADVSINTVSKLLVDAGKACADFHDEKVRGIKARRVQVDEIWSFTYAKPLNVRPPRCGKFKLRHCPPASVFDLTSGDAACRQHFERASDASEKAADGEQRDR